MRSNMFLTVITTMLLLLVFVLPATASDYTLGIFGNANEDNTINMQDVTYTELIILEFRDETQLADAKYDDEIDILDVTQIELVILGREKELTLLDTADRIVTIDMPVERIIVTYSVTGAVIKALEVEDKGIAVGDTFKRPTATTFFPELSKLPSVGDTWRPDAEKILELKPDLVVYSDFVWGGETLVEQLGHAGIPIIILDSAYYRVYTEEVEKLGYIFGAKDKADEYIDWYQGYLDIIAERVEGLSEEDKPRVFYTASHGDEDWHICGSDDLFTNPKIKMAGGTSITGDLSGSTVDPEWVIEQNPELVLLRGGYLWNGYGTDDPSGLKEVRDEFISRPEMEFIDAVKEGEVYVNSYEVKDTAWFVGVAYMAKWFHPELFEDLDPNAIHQEWLTEFQRLDYDLDEHGVFVYHPEKHPDGK